jgi:phosphonate transport system substrate-binding protein
MKRLFWLLVLGLAHGTAFALTLAVVPQFTPVDINRRWTPLIERLSADTGLPIELRTYKRIPDFEKDMLAGQPDLVYLNPYHMVMAHKAQSYIPLVRGEEMLAGVLVVRRDGPIKSIQQLNGQTLAFPAPNAFGASLYMRALLTRKFKVAYKSNYVGTHQNVLRQVAMGEAAAGGAVMLTYQREPEGLRNQLTVLYETPKAAPHPLAIHPRVAAADRLKLKNALLRLAKDPAGAALLKEAGLSQAIAADYDSDYAQLDELGLETFVELE